MFLSSLYANKESLNEQYNSYRMNYLRAVLNNDKEKEIQILKKLVYIGKKINVNTSKYESELKKLNIKTKKEIKKTTNIKKSIKKPTKKVNKKLTKEKKKTQTIKKTTNSKYNIQKVYTNENSIIIEFKHKIDKNYIDYKKERSKYSYTYTFLLKGDFKDAKPTKLAINNIKKIYITQKEKKNLRIKVLNNYRLKPIYILNKNKIIIKFLNLKKSTKKTSISKYNVPAINYEQKVVVIDPGHGGKDAGAVGSKKKYEKNAVFKISKYLYGYLKQKGYKVYLTRHTDKYIKVRNRTVLANKKNADIFISVHANSVPKSKAHKIKGIETFFLSPARSARAKRVAAQENKSDIRKMSNATQRSFLTVLNQSKITASNKLAIDVQQNMLYNLRKYYKGVEDSGVREGPFWVLVGAQMPSILIEVGYISHPTESIRLFNTNYQKRLAKGIANGVDSYFLKNP